MNRRGGARLGGGDQSVGKREKRVAANDTPFEREFRFARFPNGDAARIHAAHLACADAECPVFADIHNRVGLHMLDHAPAEQHRLQLGPRRLSFGHHFQVRGRHGFQIPFLHQK